MEQKWHEKYRVQLIVAIAFIGIIVVPFFINLAYKGTSSFSWLTTEWDADTALTYYGSVLAFVGTTFLGIVAIKKISRQMNITILDSYFEFYGGYGPDKNGVDKPIKAINGDYKMIDFEITYQAFNPNDAIKVMRDVKIEFCANHIVVFSFIPHDAESHLSRDKFWGSNVKHGLSEPYKLSNGRSNNKNGDFSDLVHTNKVYLTYTDENSKVIRTLICSYNDIEEINSFK